VVSSADRLRIENERDVVRHTRAAQTGAELSKGGGQSLVVLFVARVADVEISGHDR
jgi:hypothetical protein